MHWNDLSSKLKAYIIILAIISLPILIWAVLDLIKEPPEIGLVILAALALITVFCYVLLEPANATISIGDSYIMAIGMIYGASPCIIATFCHTFLISYFARRPKIPKYRLIFNVSCTILVAYLYSTIYHQIPYERTPINRIIFSAMVGLIFFITNSGLVSLAISWATHENFIKYWTKICSPLAIDLPVSTSVATIIVVLQDLPEFRKITPLLISPILGLIWWYYRLNNSKIIANQTRILETEKHLKELAELYIRTVEALALAVDAKDQTTYGHIRRVRAYSMELAKLCGITDPNELRAIETGALLHDIGKLAVDDYILNKPGKLTSHEYEKIKLHAAAGDEILQHVRFPFPAAKYVRCHHERWDGNGYPDGLTGEAIPLGARILSVADAFDAIRYSRPYKLSMSTDEAMEIVCSQSGTYFDPKVVLLLKNHITDIDRIALHAAENAPELSFRKFFEISAQSPFKPTYAVENPADIPVELIQLAEFCNTMGGFFNLTDIMPTLLRRLERLVPFDTCALYLDANGILLEPACVIGKYADHIRTHTIEMGRGISGWVAAYRRPMLNANPALEFNDISGFSSLEDSLAVPLIHNEEVLGAFTLYAQEPAQYSQDHQNILLTLASLIAPSIAEYKKRHNSNSLNLLDSTTQIRRISYLTAVGPQLISAAGINRSPLSLVYLDIRNLARIHHLYGGEFCNLLLRRIADCIQPELRKTDLLARYGNRGFIALMPGLRDEQAIFCAQRLSQQIKHTIAASGRNVLIECVTGVAAYPKDGTTVIDLIQSAENSLRQSQDQEHTLSDHNIIDFRPRF